MLLVCLAQDRCGEKSVQKPRTLRLVAAICIQYMLLVCLAQDRCSEKSVQKPRTLRLVPVICIQCMLLVCLAQDRSGEKSVRKPRTLPALEAGSSNGGAKSELKLYVGGSETTPAAMREKNVVRARCVSSRMLGELGVAFTVQ